LVSVYIAVCLGKGAKKRERFSQSGINTSNNQGSGDLARGEEGLLLKITLYV
jgi:hypothetical protein